VSEIREQLVATALKWQESFGVAPSITSAISELDAALLVGMAEHEYSTFMQSQTAVQRGHDFIYNGIRYQVKANRPSGKPGSKVTLVPKAKNYEWDILVWLLYTKEYEIEEAWAWPVQEYKDQFHELKRLSPQHYRSGENLLLSIK
tara:strand:- start:654 stop:1091 length:438 start_codon:yes stop_codon:yes gene_type:complete